MAYILNKNIPANKRIKNALTAIYGIGEKRALEIAHELCFSPGARFSVLSQTQISRISGLLRGPQQAGSSLQKKINENVKVLMKIRCYRGLRHKNRLPVRGQRTHTNAQTQKNKKKMIVS
jgi:small subunit ribosomal protein S13